MKNDSEFIKLYEKNYSDKELQTIKKAIKFIKQNLKGNKKLSGKSLVDFNIDVGEILKIGRAHV